MRLEKCIQKLVTVIFQPHLFSRTRDFIDDFAEALSHFDKVLLLDIYPARELPIAGVDSAWLLSKISNPDKQLVSKTELLKVLNQNTSHVVLSLGAGDIGEEVNQIKQTLSHAS